MCKKQTTVLEAKKQTTVLEANSIETLEMEAAVGTKKMNSVVGPISPDPLCMEKFRALDINMTHRLEMVSETKVGKPEHGVNAISCTTSWSENASDSRAPHSGLMVPFPNRDDVGFSSSSDLMEGEPLVLGCQTPTESIFDPFAPGAEELAFAPKKKLIKESRIPLRRQLNFDYCSDSMGNAEMDVLDAALEEEQFLELVYHSVLEVVVSNHFEVSGGHMLAGLKSFETPTSMPLLTGVAETCPATPLRCNSKSRRLSPSICRKLQF